VRVPHELEHDLAQWLVDLHAVEQQAIVHLRAARRLIGEPALAADLERHLAETERHRDTVRELLAERGRRPSRSRDAAATLNRLGFLLYTAIVPDAPGKLLADSYVYEHLEIAAYRMLAHVAELAGEERLRSAALTILGEEQEMAQRLASRFDWAVEASAQRRRKPGNARVVEHLRDAYALEAQAGALLTLGAGAVRAQPLIAYIQEERQRTQAHRRRVRARLSELGRRPALLKTTTMRSAGGGWAVAWGLQGYTAAKLVCFLYAERHLELAAYELLGREAGLTGDRVTAALAARLRDEERVAADRLAGLLEIAADEAIGGGSPAAAAAD
jgi:ferritin-like metal-binding protein YciE